MHRLYAAMVYGTLALGLCCWFLMISGALLALLGQVTAASAVFALLHHLGLVFAVLFVATGAVTLLGDKNGEV